MSLCYIDLAEDDILPKNSDPAPESGPRSISVSRSESCSGSRFGPLRTTPFIRSGLTPDPFRTLLRTRSGPTPDVSDPADYGGITDNRRSAAHAAVKRLDR